MTLLIPMLLATAGGRCGPKVLDAASHHLGTPGKPEWDEFAGSPAEGRSFEVRFNALVNRGEATLSIRQRSVKLPWRVRLNGRDIGGLFVMEEPLVQTIPVPAGALRDGENVLLIASPPGNDDIVVGEFTLDPRPVAEVAGGRVPRRPGPRPRFVRSPALPDHRGRREAGRWLPCSRPGPPAGPPPRRASTPPTARPGWASAAAGTPSTPPAALPTAWPDATSTSRPGAS